MVHSSASEPQETKSLEAIKEEARKLAFPHTQNLNSPQIAQESQAPAQANGHDAPRGFASLPAKPAGFSQTGELVGAGPNTVSPDPNNPSLPPRDVSKSIPCRFFPNCKYGDHCVFAHLSPAEAAELAKPSSLASAASPNPVGGFYYPASHPPPPFPFPSADAHANQGGMPVPLEYAHYMGMGMPYGANGAPYYPQASTAPYRGNPYAPQYPPYGYYAPPPPQADAQAGAQQVNGAPPSQVRSPQHSPSNLSPEQLYASTFSPQQNGAPSPPLGAPPVDMYPSVQNGMPNGYGMANGGGPVYPQQHYSAAQPGAPPRQPRTEAVMAASGLQGLPSQGGPPPTHRKRNSLSLNTSTNRRSSTAPAGTTFVTSPNSAHPKVGRPAGDYDPSKPPKKRSQIPCGFFATSQCRNGDVCEFSHTMPDGSDAKQLNQNIVGIDGAVGDPTVLADFRHHKAIKDREWKAKSQGREASYAGYERKSRDRFAHPNGEYQGYSNGKYRHSSHSSQRVPNGADFPALPGTPRSESVPRQASASPEPASDVDEKMTSSIASLMSVDSPKTLGSFASAAARGASVPQPTPAARKLTAAMAKATETSPRSPITTAQSLSPDTHGSPLLAAAPTIAVA